MSSDQKTTATQRFTLNDEIPRQEETLAPADFIPTSQQTKTKRIAIKKTTLAISLAGVIAASLGLLLFLAKSVTTEVTPSDAQIKITNHFAVPFGNSFLMLPGEATLSVTAEGYQTQKMPFVIDNTQNQKIDIALEKLPGHLTLTHPDASGEVSLNNEVIGMLNEKISELPVGIHTFHIDSDRYLPTTISVAIEGLDKHQQQSIELEPAWVSVELTSQPNGAAIFVDGENVGTTPMSVDLIQGERELALSLDGYKEWQYFVGVTAGEELSLPAVTLEKADGLLSVASTPANASITVDGQYMGTTPAQLALAPENNYTITLFKSGFKPTTLTKNVQSGKKNTVSVQLDAEFGEVQLAAKPEDALVYVGDRLMGRANQTLTLPAVQTKITLKKDGYADYQTVVLPKPDILQRVSASLLTNEEAKWQKIPDLMTTKVGQELLLMKPDVEFTMGSSRREQGRRANEPQRLVQLSRPFYLSKFEVTNREFKKFLPSHSSNHVKGNSLDIPNHPVVNISWDQAARYCNWLSEQEGLPAFYQITDNVVSGFNPQSTGYRLPTEVEWAWAARYDKGSMLKYPWGAQMPPKQNSGNYADRNAAPVAGFIQPQYDDGFIASSPVGKFPPNNKGLYDLGGNVAEWVHDFYEIQTGLSLKTESDPLGPTTGDFHVIRGASWAHGNITELRLSYRDYGNAVRNDVGFRIARFVD